MPEFIDSNVHACIFACAPFQDVAADCPHYEAVVKWAFASLVKSIDSFRHLVMLLVAGSAVTK